MTNNVYKTSLLSNFSNLGVEAPTMLTTLLDGLLWRARKTVQGQQLQFAFWGIMARVHDVSMKLWNARHFTPLLDLDFIARLCWKKLIGDVQL